MIDVVPLLKQSALLMISSVFSFNIIKITRFIYYYNIYTIIVKRLALMIHDIFSLINNVFFLYPARPLTLPSRSLQPV